MRQKASRAGDLNCDLPLEIPSAEADSIDNRLQQALDQYLGELETHGRVDRQAFLRQFADIGDQLEPHLDGIELILQLRPPSAADGNADPRPESQLRPLATLGDFRLIRELGRGGMGVVFEAEQLSMGRRVALKVLPFAAMVDDKAVTRFRNEVRAAASLDHRHIVPVYFVGEKRGVHFYAMQLIRGQALSAIIRELALARHRPPSANANGPSAARSAGRSASRTLVAESAAYHEANGTKDATRRANPLSNTLGESHSDYFRHVARIGIQVAEAIQHAHESGITHRDIKPGNLLLDDHGQVWVTDFGLARFESERSLTMTGDIIGTLRYMSPEQAESKHSIVDFRTDVYSLGATLYELLTLEPAFDGHDRRQLLLQLTTKEPRRPRQIDPRIPKELETIVLKAMAKEPHHRYATAMDLATDLDNYLQCKPLRAKLPTLIERAAKWSIRHPAVVWSIGLFAVTMLMFLTAATLWSRQTRRTIELAKSEADRQATSAREALVRESKISRNMARLYYSTDMREAFSAWQKRQYPTVANVLRRHQADHLTMDVRGAEWRILYSSLNQRYQPIHQIDAPIHEACLLPDGKHLAYISGDRYLRVIDLSGHENIREVQIPLEAFALAAAPDGKTLFVAGTTAYEYRLDNLANPRVFTKSVLDAESQTPVNAESLAVSPDGSFVALGFRYHGITVYDRDGNPVANCYGSTRNDRIAFSRSGNSLLVPSYSNEHPNLRLWTFRPEDRIDALCGAYGKMMYLASTEELTAGVIYPGRHVVLVDRQAQERLPYVPLPPGSFASVLQFSPNGQYLAVGTVDGTIYCWDVSNMSHVSLNEETNEQPNPKVLSAEVVHRGAVTSMCFLDDLSLISSSDDGAIVRSFPISHADFSPIGPLIRSPTDLVRLNETSIIAITYAEGDLWLLDLTSHKIEQHLLSHHPLTHVTCSGDGKCIAACDDTGATYLLQRTDSNTGQFHVFRTIKYTDSPVDAVALNANGRRLASVGNSELKLRLHDVETDRLLAAYPTDGSVAGVCFTPDEQQLVCLCNRIQVWDINTGSERKSFPEGDKTLDVVFSSDGRTMITGHWNNLIRTWDFASRRPLQVLRGHTDSVGSLTISPDDRTLASASIDGTIRLWDLARGTEYGVLTAGHGRNIAAIDFARDGTLAAAIQGNQNRFTIALWNHAAHGTPFGQHRRRPGPSAAWDIGQDFLVENAQPADGELPGEYDNMQLDSVAGAVVTISVPETERLDIPAVTEGGVVPATMAAAISRNGRLATELLGVGRAEPDQDTSIDLHLLGLGQVRVRDHIYVGQKVGAPQGLIQDGPAISTETVCLAEGEDSHGLWEMRTGSLDVEKEFYVGRHGQGELNLIDGRIVVGDALIVGRDGTRLTPNSLSRPGIVRQQGGRLAVCGERLCLGPGASSSAEYHLSGGVLELTKGELQVGDGSGATGRFVQNGGSIIASNFLVVAKSKSSRGVFDLQGGHVNAQAAWVGSEGEATLEQSGGDITLDAHLAIGYWPKSNGRYHASGGTLRARQRIWVGNRGTGRMELDGDANVECVGQEMGGFDLGRGEGGLGNLLLDEHASLSAPRMFVAFAKNSVGRVTVSGGSLNVSRHTHERSNPEPVTLLVKQGKDVPSGMLLLANRYRSDGQVEQTGGIVTIERGLLMATDHSSRASYTLAGGELHVGWIASGEGKACFNFLGGTLVTDDVQLNFTQAGGHLALGGTEKVATTKFEKDFSVTAGVIDCELGVVNGEFASDRLLVEGHFQAGGTLKLTLLGDYFPKPGDKFHILSFTSAAGSFERFDLPPLPDGLSWNLSELFNTGCISVAAAIGS